jgi:hypothetical protein
MKKCKKSLFGQDLRDFRGLLIMGGDQKAGDQGIRVTGGGRSGWQGIRFQTAKERDIAGSGSLDYCLCQITD